ncbi:MAG: hypothetical protein CWE10_16985 [Symbiobacterium thermophilum]|uniref:Uncharacterized protein n=2 Tax=Symbiobacterium thermophilum TaxID=2734 RepID=A0A953LL77_SYMTR|nr:hypothetical protein [Symbiobacterium thermophilum]
MRLAWIYGPALIGDGWAVAIWPNYDLTPWRDGQGRHRPMWFGWASFTEESEGLGLMRRWILALGLIAIGGTTQVRSGGSGRPRGGPSWRNGSSGANKHSGRRDDSMRLVNLTPHPVTLIVGDQTLTIPPEPTPARCSETRTVVGSVEVDGLEVPVTRVGFGQVQGLPAPREGVLYVVSRMVAEACRDRADLVIPDDLVRDAEGRIIGARSLARVW